ncbi:unnamed protein product [Owenia fusiformis]|uniref:Uncharacterized protein n=1 Tax=Owenia fusiformis TaxID=6347 RepID=A0A8J1Y1M8_OWEFU|nr:unnamed protein product [Owenia fusiformis]
MGKHKKSKLRSDPLVGRPAPLTDQILEDTSVRAPGRTKVRERQGDEIKFVDDKLSKKILKQAREQQEELEEEHGTVSNKKKKKTVTLGAGTSQDSEDEDLEDEDFPALRAAGEDLYETVEVNEDDEEALAMFMSHDAPARRTLADIIQEKITEKQTEIQSQMSDNMSVNMQQLDERVINMYQQISDILSKYRSGKLPKAFKIIPALNNWEQILYLTKPEEWSAASVYQATRIFASNLNAKMAQRFFNLVLLPRIRDDIAEYKKLNFHLYQALRKSLFKPAAFFKGILLPLCESGTTTLREAIIVASVLAKNSIPMLHSAAALLKIAEMDYNGANSIFLRSLLDKKYALPFRVIDAVVYHFLRFVNDKRQLPVLWHQSLLTFIQRYKEDLSSEQKDSLMELLRVHVHEQITPEIRRELVNSKCRGEEGNPVPQEMQFD